MGNRELRLIACLIVTALMPACAGSQVTERNWRYPYEPLLIYCPAYVSMKLTPGVNSLLGLTVGISTRTDVEATLGTESLWFDSVYEHVAYINPEITGIGDWTDFDACYVEDVLVAFSVSFSSYSEEVSFDALNEKYGNPTIVTWGDTYLERVLIWPKEGIMSVVNARPVGTIGVIFFPPMTYQQFRKSELYPRLPEADICKVGVDDLCDTFLQQKDPWGIGKRR
jgi:hypothetical protein